MCDLIKLGSYLFRVLIKLSKLRVEFDRIAVSTKEHLLYLKMRC